MQENPVISPETKKETIKAVSPVIKAARILQNSIRLIDKYLSHLGSFMVLALTLLCAADALGRYLFNHPIYGASEYSKILQGGAAFLCLAYALEKGAHVSVDIVYNRFSPLARVICSIIGSIISIAVFAIITWQSTLVMIKEFKSGVLVQILLVPAAPFKLLLIIGCFLFCLEAIIQLAHLIPQISRKGGNQQWTR
jgi:TRAP-type transport system small permease protein